MRRIRCEEKAKEGVVKCRFKSKEWGSVTENNTATKIAPAAVAEIVRIKAICKSRKAGGRGSRHECDGFYC